MELIPNSTCILCEEKTSVLSRTAIQPYIKQIENAFFSVNNSNLIQFQEEILNDNLCAICLQKIVIANRFKETYEDIIEKEDSLRNISGCCFFCEVKDLDFLNFNDNSNNVITKLKSFMKCTLHPTSYEECFSCLDCFLRLDIWFEMSDSIYKKMKSKSKNVKELDATIEDSSNLKVEAHQKDKENVTPPHNNIQSKTKKSKPKPKSKAMPLCKKLISSSGNIYNGQHVYKTSKSFRKALKQKLKTFKSLKNQNKDGTDWSEDVTSDSKMYFQIPYVLMINQQQKSSKLSRKSFKAKPMEVIVLSDSDENASKSGVKQAPKLLIRRPIKISLSKNFSLDTNKTFKRTKHTCYICDKEFHNVCKYKSHSLWHEKPQRLQIDLVKNSTSAQNVTSNISKEDLDNTKTTGIVNKYLSKNEENDDSNSKEAQSGDSFTSIECNEVDTENKLNSMTENLNEKDSTIEKSFNSDSGSYLSVNETHLEENKTDETLDNENKSDSDNDHDNRFTEGKTNNHNNVLSEEVDTNGITSEEKSDKTESNSNMFESDENITDDIASSLSRLYSDEVQNKSDEEIVGDNENGEIDHSKKNGKKRKLTDSIGNVEQNSGDEATPKRKKVRFALDYSFSKTSEVDDNLSDHTLNNSDRCSDNGAAVSDEV